MYDSSQRAVFLCSSLSLISCIILLWTFVINKEWGKELFGRKHLLFVMTVNVMVYSICFCFVGQHKTMAGCRIQATFIQFFGIASILYAAAVAVDAYYFMMGFSVPTSGKERQRTESKDGRGTNTSLDYYNRDTETFDSPSEIIGIDVNVVVNANKTISTDFHNGNGNNNLSKQLSTDVHTKRSKIVWKAIPRKYKLFHIVVYVYLIIGVMCLNFAQQGSSVKPYIYPGMI